MDDEPKAPPIEEQNFIAGVNVVDIGELRIARGLSRRPHTMCRHTQQFYDQRERRIWCKDCQTDIEPFDAYTILVEQYDGAIKRAGTLMQQAREAQEFALISRAAKAIDKAWRSKNTVPSCPHCNEGIWPEDAMQMGEVPKDNSHARKKRRDRLA